MLRRVKEQKDDFNMLNLFLSTGRHVIRFVVKMMLRVLLLIFITVQCGPRGLSAQTVNRKYPGPITDPTIAPCGILGNVVDVPPAGPDQPPVSSKGGCGACRAASGQQVFLVETLQANEEPGGHVT